MSPRDPLIRVWPHQESENCDWSDHFSSKFCERESNIVISTIQLIYIALSHFFDEKCRTNHSLLRYGQTLIRGSLVSPTSVCGVGDTGTTTSPPYSSTRARHEFAYLFRPVWTRAPRDAQSFAYISLFRSIRNLSLLTASLFPASEYILL